MTNPLVWHQLLSLVERPCLEQKFPVRIYIGFG
ncbi:hypothetical protein KR51_00035830 [Rubidibacter lacunae KORDI 51-2]|uniref:Uncharacterized protein n=1 Tax=Rubidibacter lacunae KORDI 51-2 TaxID=582515 RepID=U5DFA8_9CHRO|nr:hypothetical protein KR51_00035830 [Rubidibacter lacunae KORDI 51-2]